MSNSIREQIDALLIEGSQKLVDKKITPDTVFSAELARLLIANATQGEYHEAARQIAQVLKDSLNQEEDNYASCCAQLMLNTMRVFYGELFPKHYSRSLITIIERESARILNTLGLNTHSYTLDDDVFVKDIMCFTGRLVPCGMYVVDVHSGFPRSYLLKPNIWSLPSNLFFFAKAGGFRRYAQVHVHKPTIDEFSLEGRNECFKRIAEIIDLDPELLGVIGSAWYYDPKIQEVSPHLAYLSSDPLKQGGHLICLGETQAARQNALSKSKKRRALYEQGAYIPRQFMLILNQGDLRQWVTKMSA